MLPKAATDGYWWLVADDLEAHKITTDLIVGWVWDGKGMSQKKKKGLMPEYDGVCPNYLSYIFIPALNERDAACLQVSQLTGLKLQVSNTTSLQLTISSGSEADRVVW